MTARRRPRPARLGVLLGCPLMLALAAGPALAEVPEPGTITGTGSVVGAPTLKPGRWVDAYGGDTPALKHYVIDRTLKGSTLVVTAGVPATGGYDTPRVSFDKPDGTSCYAFSSGRVERPAGRALGSATSGPVSSSGIDPTSGCTESDRLLVTVESPEEVPAEAAPLDLTVTEIPAAAGAAALPKLPDKVAWQAPPSDTQGVQTTGGSGGEPGPLLTEGSYQSTISPGQSLRFQVRAGWGQSISTTSSLSAQIPTDAEKPELATTVIGPNGASAQVNVSDGPSSARTVYGSSTVQVGAQTAPVLYRNLAETRAFGASQPGTYTIVVSLSQTEGLTEPIPFLFQIGVHDGPATAPQFAAGEQIDTGGYDDPVVAVGGTGKDGQAGDDGQAGTGRDGKATTDSSGDTVRDEPAGTGLLGLPTWLVVGGLGVAGVVAILAAVLVILAARAPRRR